MQNGTDDDTHDGETGEVLGVFPGSTKVSLGKLGIKVILPTSGSHESWLFSFLISQKDETNLIFKNRVTKWERNQMRNDLRKEENFSKVKRRLFNLSLSAKNI